MKGSNNFHFKRSFSPNVLKHNKVLTSSLARNHPLRKIGTICKNITEPDCRDLDTVSHDNDNLIVTDDSCLILINSNNWNKGVSLQQSFSARHLWTTKSLVFKYAKLSGGTSHPATAQCPAQTLSLAFPHFKGISELEEETNWSCQYSLCVTIWLSSSKAVWGLAYLVFDLRHF